MDQGISSRFGFRFIELNQPIAPGNHGKLFYFSVNGIAVPVHGSNWIPMDAFQSPQRVNQTTLEYRFIGLNDTYQNMMRNWGGGIYQHDEFYDLADKYGVMIWEDMMFASDDYWMQKDFLKSITKEVFDQVRRIQYHPSIAVWAGNNENAPRCSKEPAAYSELYFATILDNIQILDNTRPLLASSPSDGNETEQQPCSNARNDPWQGDMHKYLYDQDCWNTSIYIRSRFQSEFGIQSWPSFSTMSEYIPSDQRYYNSSLMFEKNKHPHGQSQMLVGIQFHYNIPPNYNSNESYEYMLYLTQLTQAYCYKVEIEFYRSTRYNCSDTLPGCNMGQMYWQTNDIWPGASWSSMDWAGRYKMVQYYAQHFNQPIIVSGFINYVAQSNQKIDGYEFWLIGDESANGIRCPNCTLEFFSYSWSNGSITSFVVDIEFKNPPFADMIYSMTVSDLLSKTKCDTLTDCVIKWVLHDDSMNILTTNWMFVESPKKSIAKDPKLQITQIKKSVSNKMFIISISVENTAAFVWFETSINGYFDDNGLLMEPGSYDNIIFHSRSNTTTVQELQNDLYVYSLYEAGGFMTS